ncbi:hypothetical protein QJS10_CPB13g00914 [Acorus calamus]|uniref:Uncharacterized protein n=1 Tax=Acorus calamus TaxID=4465 RepID=A0AAV9DID8_ACOCL|nr:hypothetical protein QJS10_CPB13g00914 [Acorus calamus]
MRTSHGRDHRIHGPPLVRSEIESEHPIRTVREAVEDPIIDDARSDHGEPSGERALGLPPSDLGVVDGGGGSDGDDLVRSGGSDGGDSVGSVWDWGDRVERGGGEEVDGGDGGVGLLG